MTGTRFLSIDYCDSLGVTVAASSGLVVAQADEACGSAPFGGVFMMEPATGSVLGSNTDVAAYPRLGYELAINEAAERIAMSWDGYDSGVVLSNRGGTQTGTVFEPGRTLGVSIGWSGDYLLVGDPVALGGRGQLLVFDSTVVGGSGAADAMVVQDGSASDSALGGYFFKWETWMGMGSMTPW